MPTYDYRCRACGHELEEFHSINARPLRKCPKCKKPKLERLIGTGAGILFRGGGFYQTDYRSEGYKQAESAEKSGGDAKAKSDASDSKGEASSSKGEAPGSKSDATAAKDEGSGSKGDASGSKRDSSSSKSERQSSKSDSSSKRAPAKSDGGSKPGKKSK